MKKYVCVYLKDDVQQIVNQYPLFHLKDFINEELPRFFFDIERREKEIEEIKKIINKKEKELKNIKETIHAVETANIKEFKSMIKKVKEQGRVALEPCYKRYCNLISKKIPFVLFIQAIQDNMRRK